MTPAKNYIVKKREINHQNQLEWTDLTEIINPIISRLKNAADPEIAFQETNGVYGIMCQI